MQITIPRNSCISKEVGAFLRRFRGIHQKYHWKIWNHPQVRGKCSDWQFVHLYEQREKQGSSPDLTIIALFLAPFMYRLHLEKQEGCGVVARDTQWAKCHIWLTATKTKQSLRSFCFSRYLLYNLYNRFFQPVTNRHMAVFSQLLFFLCLCFFLFCPFQPQLFFARVLFCTRRI